MGNRFALGGPIVALVLLIGGFVAAPAVARQMDRGAFPVLHGTAAPQAAVTVAENEVEWATDDGNDVSYASPGTLGVFFIRDDALETTASGTAVWDQGTQTTTAQQLFSIPDGNTNLV